MRRISDLGGKNVPGNHQFLANKIWIRRLNRAKLIEFEQSGLLRLSVKVEIHPGAVMDELPLIVTLGCYLIVMMNMDAAVATTAAMG